MGAEMSHNKPGTAKPSLSGQHSRQMEDRSRNGIIWFSNNLQILSSIGEATQDMLRMYDDMQTQLNAKDDKIRQLESRMAQLMNDKVTRNQGAVETITSANRPTDVQTECFNFYASKVLRAIETIGKARTKKSSKTKCDEVEDSFLAYVIFQLAYTGSASAASKFQEGLKYIFHRASDVGTELSKQLETKGKQPFSFEVKYKKTKDVSDLPPSFEDSVKVLMKETAHTCSMEDLTKEVISRFEEYIRKEEWICSNFSTLKLLDELRSYINESIRLAWKMVTQTPPILIDCQPRRDTTGKFDSAWNVEKVEISAFSATKGLLILWPVMYEEGSCRVICKGELAVQK